MTSKFSLIWAVSLLISGFHIFYQNYFLENKYVASNFVFLIGISLLLRNINILPSYCWINFPILCSIFELPLTLLVLEIALNYIWRPFQNYIVSHADGCLVHLSETPGVQCLICHLCCGTYCPDVIAGVLLKMTSFAFLFSVCSFTKLGKDRNHLELNHGSRSCLQVGPTYSADTDEPDEELPEVNT